jgi:hypothetical protein
LESFLCGKGIANIHENHDPYFVLIEQVSFPPWREGNYASMSLFSHAILIAIPSLHPFIHPTSSNPSIRRADSSLDVGEGGLHYRKKSDRILIDIFFPPTASATLHVCTTVCRTAFWPFSLSN